MILQKALKLGTNLIKNSSSPELDAELLAAYCLKKNSNFIVTHPKTSFNFWTLIRFGYLIFLRRQGWPIAYLIKNKEFYGFNFKINRHVLVPRPDSEILIEQAVNQINSQPDINTIIDIGTGSGCLAITLAKIFPEKKIIATDISSAALKMAQINSVKHQIKNILFYKGDKLKPIKDLVNKQIKLPYLLLSNPPYLSTKTYTKFLSKEPYLALWGGPDGLRWYRDFFNQLNVWPKSFWPISIIMEISPELAESITLLNKQLKTGYQTKIAKDLSNKNRVVIFTKNK